MIKIKKYMEGEDFHTKNKIVLGPLFTSIGFRGLYFLINNKKESILYRIDKVKNKWKYLTFSKHVTDNQ